jgi:hypothetical protein
MAILFLSYDFEGVFYDALDQPCSHPFRIDHGGD